MYERTYLSTVRRYELRLRTMTTDRTFAKRAHCRRRTRVLSITTTPSHRSSSP